MRRFCLILWLVVWLVLPYGASADLPRTIARVKPSLVVVGLHNPLKSPSFEMRGTGFAVADGRLIATNSHVIPEGSAIAEGSRLSVLVREGETLKVRSASLVARDSEHDLAILQIDPPPLPALPLATVPTREGQEIAFMGFPLGGALGFSPVTHRGIVSSITPIVQPTGHAQQLNDAAIRRLRASPFLVYQLDATAYPGNSGGPLFDPESGEVIGVINMVFVKEGRESALSKPSGISYAIPVSHLQDLLRKLIPAR